MLESGLFDYDFFFKKSISQIISYSNLSAEVKRMMNIS